MTVCPFKNVLPNEAEAPRRVFASWRDEPRAFRDVGERGSSVRSFPWAEIPFSSGFRQNFVRSLLDSVGFSFLQTSWKKHSQADEQTGALMNHIDYFH